MILIEEYIKLPKVERQKHLKLEDPCLERGGQSMYLKGLLAHIRDTTIPSGKKIHVCHACHNAACSNPDHLYWGTPAENNFDKNSKAKADGTYKTIWQIRVEKLGEEEARKQQNRGSVHAAKAGKGNLGTTKSELHRSRIAESLRGRKRAPYKKAI